MGGVIGRFNKNKDESPSSCGQAGACVNENQGLFFQGVRPFLLIPNEYDLIVIDNEELNKENMRVLGSAHGF